MPRNVHPETREAAQARPWLSGRLSWGAGHQGAVLLEMSVETADGFLGTLRRRRQCSHLVASKRPSGQSSL